MAALKAWATRALYWGLNEINKNVTRSSKFNIADI